MCAHACCSAHVETEDNFQELFSLPTMWVLGSNLDHKACHCQPSALPTELSQ